MEEWALGFLPFPPPKFPKDSSVDQVWDADVQRPPFFFPSTAVCRPSFFAPSPARHSLGIKDGLSFFGSKAFSFPVFGLPPRQLNKVPLNSPRSSSIFFFSSGVAVGGVFFGAWKMIPFFLARGCHDFLCNPQTTAWPEGAFRTLQPFQMLCSHDVLHPFLGHPSPATLVPHRLISSGH